MTNESKLFETAPGKDRLALYDGKMIWQFDDRFAPPRYWVDEKRGRAARIGRREDRSQRLDYQGYRLGFCDIARNTDTRTLICTVIPPAFHGNKLPTVRIFDDEGRRLIGPAEQLFVCAVWNSFVLDWMIRQKVSATLNFFYLFQLPLQRLSEADPEFRPIDGRAARLICTTREFAELAQVVGVGSHEAGAADPAERARLRAELDGLIAHLYGLTEAEFAHVLRAFPLVASESKRR